MFSISASAAWAVKNISFKLISEQTFQADSCTGTSLSEALLFVEHGGEHVVYKNCSECQKQFMFSQGLSLEFSCTLESRIDIGQKINVGPGKFDKNNNGRALNKHRVWKKSNINILRAYI